VIRLCRKFGITSRLVPNLPLALGASDLTLLEHTSAFTTFPDDGVHVTPRMIDRVTNYDGRVIDDFQPEVTDVLPASAARLMVSMLREVFNSGTAEHAKSLAQKYPMAGKTGTTNDFSDAWFLGFTPSITCGVYVGFDDHQTLGDKEEGARVALPIWMQFMSEYLKGRPVEDFPHSPLLTDPNQVKEILASASPEQFIGAKTSTLSQAVARPASEPGGQFASPAEPRPTASPSGVSSTTSTARVPITPVSAASAEGAALSKAKPKAASAPAAPKSPSAPPVAGEAATPHSLSPSGNPATPTKAKPKAAPTPAASQSSSSPDDPKPESNPPASASPAPNHAASH